MSTDRIRVFQVATGNVGSRDDQADRPAPRPRAGRRSTATRRTRSAATSARSSGIDPVGVIATGTVEEIIAARARRRDLPRRLPRRRPLRAGPRGRHQHRHDRRLDHRPPPQRQPPAPVGPHEVSEVLAAACERGGSTFYGTGHEPRPDPDPRASSTPPTSPTSRTSPCIESVDVSCHHSVDTWRRGRLRPPGRRPRRCPAMLEKYTAGVRRLGATCMADCFDLELDEVAFAYELGACTKDVDLGWYQLPEGLARRQLPQVPGPRRRRAPRRDAPRVADDAAHRPELGHQGLLHHPDQGRPADLQQAHDLPEPGRRPLRPRRRSPRSA